LTNRPSEKIFFLHIPKCGGVSVGQAIAVKYLSLNLRNDSGVINLNAPVSRQVVEEKLLLYFMAQPNSRFISGHFLFSKIAYQKHGGKFSFVTILRDPVKRWISSYFYNIFKASDHMKVNDEIDARLESHFGISQGYELVKFLGGANKEGDYTSPKAIDRATENLKRFEVVGFLENLSDFTEKFYARFHVKLQIAKKNQNPAPIQYQKSIITHELLERITDVCQPDIQVYEYAIQHFGDQEY
jgi:hypothetical protein